MRCTAFMTADKNVNRLESRKLRTPAGCDAGPHVFRRPGVLYMYIFLMLLSFPEIPAVEVDSYNLRMLTKMPVCMAIAFL